MTSSKYLVVKGQAGLGNRMLCATTGVLYARLARRKLVVDWSDGAYSNDRCNAFPKLFRCPEASESWGRDSDADSIRPGRWRGHMAASAAEMIRDFDPDKFSSPTIHLKYSIDLSRLDYAETIAVMWAFSHQIRRLRRHFVGPWAWLAPLDDEAILRQVFREALQPQPDVLARVSGFVGDHFAGPVVGVHVRYTDRRSSLDAYVSRVERQLRQHPRARVFLATDNWCVVDRFRGEFGEPLQTPKWFPPPGACMHQNPQCPDRLRNAQDALVDMFLLARCQSLVYSRRSTFSYIASILSDAPPHERIDVDRFRLVARARQAVRDWMT